MKGEKEKIIEKNRSDYGDFYNELRFVTSEQAYSASTEREDHIEFLKSSVKWCFNRTKADCMNLSVGCQLCGEGNWSCLFINNACNANCFYCPAPQDDFSQPTTQTVEFPDAEDYVAYIKKFNFRGVSISGGEPFLSFEQSLHFVSQIRKEFGNSVYLWLYTNGILATEDNLKRLKEAGLNEIRFDIGATGYSTDKVRLACKIIDTVTVEVPAVPEEFDRMKKLMPELGAMGVKHLNLHQLRCTPHNYKKLIKRGYTFLHGPKITVLESELTALRLLRYSVENQIDLPVNYCSFIYKYRYQRLAARKKFAPFITESYEDITETGMIRTCYVKGEETEIIKLVNELQKAGVPDTDYRLNGNRDSLFLKLSLWNYIDFSRLKVSIGYDHAFILPGVSYRNRFKEINLSSKKKVVVERAGYLKTQELSENQRKVFEGLIVGNRYSQKDYRHVDTILDQFRPKCAVDDELDFLVKSFECERLRWGLLDYY